MKNERESCIKGASRIRCFNSSGTHSLCSHPCCPGVVPSQLGVTPNCIATHKELIATIVIGAIANDWNLLTRDSKTLIGY